MKSGVSPQKLRKYGRKTPIWEPYSSICISIAPSQLISSGHSPRLGGHNFRLGGPGPGMLPLGAGPEWIKKYRIELSIKHSIQRKKIMYYNCTFRIPTLTIKKLCILSANLRFVTDFVCYHPRNYGLLNMLLTFFALKTWYGILWLVFCN